MTITPETPNQPTAQGVGVNTMVRCQICGKNGAQRRRQNSAYVDDNKNFATLCDDCQEDANEYWQERWNDYYSMIL